MKKTIRIGHHNNNYKIKKKLYNKLHHIIHNN